MFREVIDIILDVEGGFQKLATDPGNWTGGSTGSGFLKGTKYGISAAQYPDLDIEALSKDDARRIYRRDYYDRYKLHRLPRALVLPVLDAVIHEGPFVAISRLQRLVGVPDDGIIGPATATALESATIDGPLIWAYHSDRLERFSGHAFAKGFARRTLYIAQMSLAGLHADMRYPGVLFG